MKELISFLSDVRNELHELYSGLDWELSHQENKTLLDEAYNGAMKKIEDALEEMDTLINDIDSGVYEVGNLDMDDDMLEVDE